jgi:hypothetical protein
MTQLADEKPGEEVLENMDLKDTYRVAEEDVPLEQRQMESRIM